MEMNFRIGTTNLKMMNADFHIPKAIILDMTRKSGFEIANDNIIDVISFLSYLNKHSVKYKITNYIVNINIKIQR